MVAVCRALVVALLLFDQCIAIMFFPPACIGQRRVCSGGDCHCEPAPPRDTASFDTLNKIGIAMGQKDQWQRKWDPPNFAEINAMHQRRQDAHVWEIDHDRRMGIH